MGYREETVQGTSWVRVNKVIITTPLGVTPTMDAVEETVLDMGGGNVTVTPVGTPIHALYNAADSFALRDPVTDAPTTTTMTQQDLQVAVYSFVRHLQDLRDAGCV